MFYINAVTQGNNILERYIDDDGQDCQRKVAFEPSLFKHDKSGNLKDIYGKRAKEVFFETMTDARKWKKSMTDMRKEALGMDDFVLQYLYKTYKGPMSFDIAQIDIAYVDIEVPTDDGFPFPEISRWEIDAIGHYSTKLKQYHIFSTREWNREDSKLTQNDDGVTRSETLGKVIYNMYNSEKEMLVGYLKFWRENLPHVISGWNSEKFDIPYIVQRYRKVLGDRFANKLSPWDKISERTVFDMYDKEVTVYDIQGVSCIDYMDAYKKFTFTTRPSYKLGDIGELELGMTKMPMNHKSYLAFSTDDPQSYVDYLIRDVELLVRLDERLSLFHLILSVSYYARINYSATFSPLKTWDAIIHNSLIEQGIVVPENKRVAKERYAGAYVKEPNCALYRWLKSFDLTSLYPHLIMQFNISPETIIDQVEVAKIMLNDRWVPDIEGIGMIAGTYKVPHGGHSFAPNGMRYDSNKRGIIPIEIEKVFLQRKEAKGLEFAADKRATECQANHDDDGVALWRKEEKMQNVQQMARKVLINSLYGALGNQHFRYYDVRNAEAITMGGQLAIRWIERKMNEFMNKTCGTTDFDYVCYIDTDSIYVNSENLVNMMAERKGIEVDSIDTMRWIEFLDKFAEQKCEPFIQESYQEMADYTNSYAQKMFMDREVIADRGFWTGKKRYALNVWDSEGKRKYDDNGNVVPKLKIMGIETQRSTTPLFAGKSLKKAINIILTEDEETLQSFVTTVADEYPKQPYQQIASVASINNIEKYCTPDWQPIKGCLGHVKAALTFNREAEKHSNVDLIVSGEKVQILLLKQPNKLHSESIAYTSGAKIPDEFGLDMSTAIDYNAMRAKHFNKPLETICDAIGWEQEKKMTLASLFDM